MVKYLILRNEDKVVITIAWASIVDNLIIEIEKKKKQNVFFFGTSLVPFIFDMIYISYGISFVK